MPFTSLYVEEIPGGFAVTLNSPIGADFFEVFDLTLADAMAVAQTYASDSDWMRRTND